MRAIGYQTSKPVSAPDFLVDIEMPKPVASGRDLLVAVQAVSVNPVDTKVRKRGGAEPGGWKVLGWDAVGRVEAVGADVTRFRPGDSVFYAGALQRQGTNSEFHLVDERIVGRAPASLSAAEAAALPLTAITAWEMLFDRLDVRRAVPGGAEVILIIGGSGGVGSIATQLARELTDLTVVSTASRPETREWSLGLGAHHVLDHRGDLAAQMAALGIGAPSFVFSTTHSGEHMAAIVALIAPQGRFGLIDDPDGIDLSLLKQKSLSLHWEFMYTRSMFGTADMDEQGALLDEVSRLVDEGKLRSTLGERLGPITAENLRRAHTLIESDRAIGKVVLEGWP